MQELSHRIVDALNPDRHVEQAKADLGIAAGDDRSISDEALAAAREKILRDAVKPLNDPNPPFGKKSSTTIVGEEGKVEQRARRGRARRLLDHDLEQAAQLRPAREDAAQA